MMQSLPYPIGGPVGITGETNERAVLGVNPPRAAFFFGCSCRLTGFVESLPQYPRPSRICGCFDADQFPFGL
jgi:hypothetical protein